MIKNKGRGAVTDAVRAKRKPASVITLRTKFSSHMSLKGVVDKWKMNKSFWFGSSCCHCLSTCSWSLDSQMYFVSLLTVKKMTNKDFHIMLGRYRKRSWHIRQTLAETAGETTDRGAIYPVTTAATYNNTVKIVNGLVRWQGSSWPLCPWKYWSLTQKVVVVFCRREQVVLDGCSWTKKAVPDRQIDAHIAMAWGRDQ